MTDKFVQSEKVFFDDDRLVVKRTIDAGKMLQEAQYARETSPNEIGSDHKLVGTVGMPLVHEWLKEAGVSWSDTHADQHILKSHFQNQDLYKYLRLNLLHLNIHS
jgi:hypothetical protein